MIKPKTISANPMPAVAYLRMSDLSQDTSIEQQREQVETLASRDGYAILEWYVDEGKSGSHSVHKRKSFLKMLSDAEKKVWKAKAVLCLDISRFGRLDTIEGAFAKQVLRDAGMILHTVLEGKTDWREQNDRIVDAVMSEAQHDYSFRLGQKTLKGKLRAFEKGGFFGFKVPYGYARQIIDDQGNRRTVGRMEKFVRPKSWQTEVILGDSDEVEVVRWMFKEFDSRDIGYRYLAAQLNLKGTPSPTGKLWSSKVISDVLINEKYVGDLTLGKNGDGQFWRLDGDEVVRTETKGSTKKEPLAKRDVIPPIVSREQFDRVQIKVRRRKESGTHSEKEGGYLLKGVLYCGNCGRPLYGNPNRNRPNVEKRKSGKVIYVCKTAITYGKACGCGQWSVKEEDILPFLKREAVNAIDKDALRRAAFHPKPDKKNIAAIEKKIAELSRNIERGTERFLTAPPELTADIATMLQGWKEQRSKLQHEFETEQAAKSTWSEVLRYRTQKFAELRGKLLHIETATFCNGKFATGFTVSNDSFRQLLIDAGVRLDFWWERASSCRWKVAKVRVRLGGNAQFVTLASLIV